MSYFGDSVRIKILLFSHCFAYDSQFYPSKIKIQKDENALRVRWPDNHTSTLLIAGMNLI
jgi:hypothetical protein